jgi:glycosyltransferase involved in cell wall biosynthesis
LTRFETPADPVRLRRELGLPDYTPLVAVVSRLARLKGIEHFIEAAALLAPRYPAVRFLVVGETSPTNGSYLTLLRDLAAQRGIGDRVIFTGRRSDVPALLSSVNVSVMPSLSEALSNVLLESMAAGAPVVATRVGGTPEVLVGGVSGLLVPPGDPRALVVSISSLLDNPRLASRLGESARRTVLERFSVEQMVSATEELYMQLLARKERRLLPAA